jgi:hypothetical protein
MAASYSPLSLNVPGGLKPGDIPAGLTWPKSLWIVLPPSLTPSQQQSLSRLRDKARQRTDMHVAEIKIEKKKGIGGLGYPLVRSTDIAGLYQQAHRARTAVIALCGAKVLLDVSELPSSRGCMSLERFIQYKCFFALVSRPQEAEEALKGALVWMSGIHCQGPRDPRCIPSAIFETQRPYTLETPDEREEFVNLHKATRSSNDLIDTQNRTWHVGPPHTRDLIQVGGQTLPIGFHWDVQAKRTSVIATGWETWRLPGRGYTNVHPDAKIRDGNATKTHPPSPKREKKGKSRNPRTPRNLRQGRGGHQ